jgi:hypothetical protein
MLVEAVPRGYGDDTRQWLDGRVAPALATELDVLEFPPNTDG